MSYDQQPVIMLLTAPTHTVQAGHSAPRSGSQFWLALAAPAYYAIAPATFTVQKRILPHPQKLSTSHYC